MFKEQVEEMEELHATGASYKDVNIRIWKMKEIICGPKVGPAEPACINNPISGELVTDKETIKKVNLEHWARILSKNEKSQICTQHKQPRQCNIILGHGH